MKKNILLASAFINNNYTFSKYYHKLPTLGIGYISSVLNKNGYKDVAIIDRTLHINEFEDFTKDIFDKRPDILGFYSVSENYKFILQIFQRVKKERPEIITVIGGPHVYGLPEASVRPECIDFGIYGEGEAAFLELLKSNFDPAMFPFIKGLIYKENGEVKVNTFTLINNLDEIPFPARHLYPPLDIYRPSILAYKKLPATGIITSRGCAHKCVFCHSGKGHFKLRFHSAEYVLDEIKHLKKEFGINEFVFFDDTFLINRERALNICEDIIRENLKISWSCNTRVNNLNKELLRVLKKAGCWLIQLGVESGNQDILKTIKKGITLEQVEKACKLAYDEGFEVKTYFILGNPNETVKTINDTIKFMTKLPAHYASINFMTPLPGTELWDVAEQYGTIDKEKLEKINYLSDKPAFIPYGLTEEILINKFREAYLKFYLNPKTILRHIKTIRSREDFKKILMAGAILFRLVYARLFKIKGK